MIGQGAFSRVFADPDDPSGFCFRERDPKTDHQSDQESDQEQNVPSPAEVREVAIWRHLWPERPADVVVPGASLRLPRVPGEELRGVLNRGDCPPPGLRGQVLCAALDLAKLHAAGLYHGDVSTGNVMVSPGRMHLVDFAGASTVRTLHLRPKEGYAWTPGFVAPEVVRVTYPNTPCEGLDRQLRQRGLPSDVWSLGAVVYSLATRQKVMTRRDDIQTVRRGGSLEGRVRQWRTEVAECLRDREDAEGIYEIFCSCTELVPRMRMSAGDIVEKLGGRPPAPRGRATPPASRGVSALEARMPREHRRDVLRIRRRFLTEYASVPRVRDSTDMDLADLHRATVILAEGRTEAAFEWEVLWIWDILEALDYDLEGSAPLPPRTPPRRRGNAR